MFQALRFGNSILTVSRHVAPRLERDRKRTGELAKGQGLQTPFIFNFGQIENIWNQAVRQEHAGTRY